MSAKQLAARCTAVITALVFGAALSVGAYSDAGGWLAVAVVWAGAGAIAGMARLFVWAVENWNTP